MEDQKTNETESLFQNKDFFLRYICLAQHLENQSAANADTNPQESIELLKDAIFMLKEIILDETSFSEDELVESIRQNHVSGVPLKTDALTRKIIKKKCGIEVTDDNHSKIDLKYELSQLHN